MPVTLNSPGLGGCPPTDRIRYALDLDFRVGRADHEKISDGREIANINNQGLVSFLTQRQLADCFGQGN